MSVRAAQSGSSSVRRLRAWGSAAVVLGMGAVAVASLRGGFFARGASAEFASAALGAEALSDGIIDIPREASSLQAAVDAAMDGMIIRLGAGDFVGPVRVEGKSLRIQGQGMDRSTIHGFGRGPAMELIGTGHQRIEIEALSIAGASGVTGCGMLVQGVDADIHGVRFRLNTGAGAVVRGGAPVFNGCRFEENSDPGYGGGLRNEGGSPVLIDCVFLKNVAGTFGGAIYSRGGSVSMLDCSLEGNSTRCGAWGGAIFGDGAALDLHGTDFLRNRSLEAGGALYLVGGSAEISQCSFTGDYAEAARSIFSRGAGVRIERSTLCGERAAVLGGDLTADEGTIFDLSCFPDCDGNGIADSEEIANGWANDADGNGIPDGCDPDCNGNGIPDAYEIAQGWARDANRNGIIDSCEIASGMALDADHDGIPDDAPTADSELQEAAAGETGAVAPSPIGEGAGMTLLRRLR